MARAPGVPEGLDVSKLLGRTLEVFCSLGNLIRGLGGFYDFMRAL